VADAVVLGRGVVVEVGAVVVVGAGAGAAQAARARTTARVINSAMNFLPSMFMVMLLASKRVRKESG